MKAVILAGGKGTRLRPYTITIPKPLLPIGEISSIELLARQLAAAGATELFVSLAYKGGLIQAMLGDGSSIGTSIHYVTEDRPLGTAGCLRLIAPRLDQPVIVCNGDLLCDFAFDAVLSSHRESGAAITICVREQQVPIPFGVVEFDDQQRLSDYREKPMLSYWVSTGVNVISPEAVSLIASDERIDMPDLHLRALARGLPVRCMPLSGQWFDIGSFADYQRACEVFEQDPGHFLPGNQS